MFAGFLVQMPQQNRQPARNMQPQAVLAVLKHTLCRGFAFVDFLSKQEARSAADAVTGTHLYGRRLVSHMCTELTLTSDQPRSY